MEKGKTHYLQTQTILHVNNILLDSQSSGGSFIMRVRGRECVLRKSLQGTLRPDPFYLFVQKVQK